MNRSERKNRCAFRPTLGDIRLEERVVLNGTPTMNAALIGQVVATPSSGASQSVQNVLGNLNARQVRSAFRQQLGAAQTALRQFARDQVTTLFSDTNNIGTNGRPSADALANFNANLAGALNATTLQLSSQASLLPGSSRRLLPNLQESLLGNRNNSLINRLGGLSESSVFLRSQNAFQNAINRQINGSFLNNSARLNNFFLSTPLNRLSVDAATGQRIPLSQFLGNRALNQINNTFGTLANNVGPNAQATLFDSTGVFNAQAVPTFQRQFADALGTAAFQTSSVLSLFPNVGTTLTPQLQSAFFGTGIDPTTGLASTSFFNGMTGLFPTGIGTGTTPFTFNDFNTGFQNAFTTGFQNFTNPLNNFFGVVPTSGTGGNFQLPAGFFQSSASFPGVLGSQFSGSTFNNGFNNGFLTTGTGFPGFGTAPTGFNTNFGTGFNNFIGGVNTQFGFTAPTFGNGTGVGTGIGTGIGTGVGTGIGTGTGTGTGTGIGTGTNEGFV